jgi:hypothetical protein
VPRWVQNTVHVKVFRMLRFFADFSFQVNFWILRDRSISLYSAGGEVINSIKKLHIDLKPF